MSHPNPNFELIQSFHSKLYNTHPPTPLISLPELATQLGCAGVYVKDESERFGLPAFKILGASWGLCSALAERVGVDVLDLEGVGREARGRDIRVYAATDGGSNLIFSCDVLRSSLSVSRLWGEEQTSQDGDD
jgi:threonine dehydratase